MVRPNWSWGEGFERRKLASCVLVGWRCAGGSEEAYARSLEEKMEVERKCWKMEDEVILHR